MLAAEAPGLLYVIVIPLTGLIFFFAVGSGIWAGWKRRSPRG